MPLETATYISDLNASNPVGATDTKATLDDHIRLLKSTVKATFPNVSGAVTPTHTDLNKVGVTQAQSSNDTSVASTAYVRTAVAAAAVSATIPTVVGDAGKVMGTDGTTPDWTSGLKATVMRFEDGTDATKKLAFSLSGITTATTRTVTVPDKDGTMAMLSDGASQAQMEAASSNSVFATPANAQWHPSAAKAWLQCDEAGTIDASYNVTSITDDGTGLLTVTIATDFSGANYVAVGTAQHASSAGVVTVTSKLVGAAAFKNALSATGSASDPTKWNIAFFGDQA